MSDPVVDKQLDGLLESFLLGYAPESVRKSLRMALTRNLRIEEYDQP